MASPLRDLIFGRPGTQRELVAAMVPRRTFEDVILPPGTVRALNYALTQIRKHDLIFNHWGLAERHATGLGLAFNFAGPPGTGKTICAEAIAHALRKKLLVVRYAEIESMWAGETSKNVATVFRSAAEQDAVLFFDEADAIAGRRFTSVSKGYEREANTVVNVLLKELEDFPGVVVFATNLAANFDPAFERRIRTHILFEMPGPAERERIWQVQLHARKTPLADDVDFRALAEQFEASGGDIKNAVLKAAQIASGESGPDAEKQIHQRHFVEGIQDVLASKRVMDQSLFGADDNPYALAGPVGQLSSRQDLLEDNLTTFATRLVEIEDRAAELPEVLERMAANQSETLEALAADRAASEAASRRQGNITLGLAVAALASAVGALAVAIF